MTGQGGWVRAYGRWHRATLTGTYTEKLHGTRARCGLMVEPRKATAQRERNWTMTEPAKKLCPACATLRDCAEVL